MKIPACPNCRERLSDAEAGLVGIWTCLYCEGAWFSASHSTHLPFDKARDDTAGHEPPSALVCPQCDGTGFESLRKPGLSLHRCRTCSSSFLPKATVIALGDALGGGRWGLGESIAVLVGRTQSTQVDAALLVAGIVVLLFT